MPTPTKIVYRAERDPALPPVAWEYVEFYAYNAATGQLLTADESLDPNCPFTQTVYIYAYADGQIVDSVRLYRLGQAEAKTP
jgi:hypothetical protein